MIIYGWKSVNLKSTQPQSVICPSCQSKGSTILNLYSSYAHLFWLPFFPYEKKGSSQCQECGFIMYNKEFQDELELEYSHLKRGHRIPIWQFLGVFLIAFGLLFWAGKSQQNSNMYSDYSQHPLVGDIHEYFIETDQYSTYKIHEIYVDSLLVIGNDYQIDLKSAVKDIDIDANYNDIFYMIAKTDIVDMFQEGVIYKINRD